MYDLPVILSILGDVRGVENSISLAVTPLLNNIRELAIQTQVFHRITHHVCAEVEEVLVGGNITKGTAARLMKVLDDYLHEAVDPVCGLSQGTESIFYIIKDTIFHRELEVAFNEILEKPNELLIHLDDADDTFRKIIGLQQTPRAQGEGTNMSSARNKIAAKLTGRSKTSGSDGPTPRQGPTKIDSHRSGDHGCRNKSIKSSKPQFRELYSFSNIYTRILIFFDQIK